MKRITLLRRIAVSVVVLVLAAASVAAAQEPEFTSDFDRDRCTFASVSSNPYLPLWPGYRLILEGEEEDDEGELVELEVWVTILPETETVDGVVTRVLEEREFEDEELVEVSRNFVAHCRQTGDVWYFGEDVDDYEDGEIVGHEGAWRAGVDGAEPGILMPGSPLIGARYFEEVAPGVALDRGEIVGLGEEITVPVGTFEDTLETMGTNPLDPEEVDEKFYARGVGIIVDEELELVEINPPACQPDALTHCLNDGRFQVQAEWEDSDGNEGAAMALLPSDDSGEFWFFNPNNSELIVKVLDACSLEGFNNFWVFAAGLTDVGVTISVTDTTAGVTLEYENPVGSPFAPVLDTSAFATCP